MAGECKGLHRIHKSIGPLGFARHSMRASIPTLRRCLSDHHVARSGVRVNKTPPNFFSRRDSNPC